jgi:hypothetical protein
MRGYTHGRSLFFLQVGRLTFFMGQQKQLIGFKIPKLPLFITG